ncbi:MAG: histidine phosphatase family protein, partial [Acidimicrobiales bacterium]
MSPGTTTTRVSLVRHGEVDNPTGIYYGRMKGFALSELGQLQARSIAESFEPDELAAVYSSPLLRAHQTASAIAARQGLAVARTRRLLEVRSPFDGVTLQSMTERDWDLYSDTSPKFEQPPDLVKRMRSFISYARDHHRG